MLTSLYMLVHLKGQICYADKPQSSLKLTHIVYSHDKACCQLASLEPRFQRCEKKSGMKSLGLRLAVSYMPHCVVIYNTGLDETTQTLQTALHHTTCSSLSYNVLHSTKRPNNADIIILVPKLSVWYWGSCWGSGNETELVDLVVYLV